MVIRLRAILGCRVNDDVLETAQMLVDKLEGYRRIVPTIEMRVERRVSLRSVR